MGGHEGVLVEDVALGRRLKEAGVPFSLFIGDPEISYRMYGEGLGSLLQDWTKNIAAGAMKTPPPWAILLSILLWPLLQYGAAWICHRLPDRVYRPDSWLFRSRSFEKGGRLYERLFRISRWKDLLPEGSIARKEERFSKKHLGDRREEGLRRYLLESARGELTHWLAIPAS